jgi:Flp pilus assembly pilin Flp
MRIVSSKPFSLEGEEGQTMVEYAVVLGVITLAVMTALAALSGNISSAVTAIAGRV